MSLFVGPLYPSSGPEFLGHGERAPDIEVTPRYVEHQTDSGGDVAAELIYAGSSARISVDLVRYNMNTLKKIQARARGRASTNAFPNAVPGFDDAGQIGTLMVVGGCTFPLYLLFPASTRLHNSSFASGAMPPGYRFVAAYLNPECMKMGATSPFKNHLIFDCLRKRDYTRKNGAGRGSYLLYNADVSAVQSVPD